MNPGELHELLGRHAVFCNVPPQLGDGFSMLHNKPGGHRQRRGNQPTKDRLAIFNGKTHHF